MFLDPLESPKGTGAASSSGHARTRQSPAPMVSFEGAISLYLPCMRHGKHLFVGRVVCLCAAPTHHTNDSRFGQSHPQTLRRIYRVAVDDLMRHLSARRRTAMQDGRPCHHNACETQINARKSAAGSHHHRTA